MEEKGEENGVAAMKACYQKFDPAAYLQYNYTPPRADFTRNDSIVPWKLACLHRAFTEGKACVKWILVCCKWVFLVLIFKTFTFLSEIIKPPSGLLYIQFHQDQAVMLYCFYVIL